MLPANTANTSQCVTEYADGPALLFAVCCLWVVVAAVQDATRDPLQERRLSHWVLHGLPVRGGWMVVGATMLR